MVAPTVRSACIHRRSSRKCLVRSHFHSADRKGTGHAQRGVPSLRAGVDVNAAVAAIDRTAGLIKELAGGEILQELDAYPRSAPRPVLLCDSHYFFA